MAAVARLIVSVLLPTPPFQARSAMTFIGVPSRIIQRGCRKANSYTAKVAGSSTDLLPHRLACVDVWPRWGLTLRCSKLTPLQERAKVVASSPALRPEAVRRNVRSHSFTAWLWPD